MSARELCRFLDQRQTDWTLVLRKLCHHFERKPWTDRVHFVQTFLTCRIRSSSTLVVIIDVWAANWTGWRCILIHFSHKRFSQKNVMLLFGSPQSRIQNFSNNYNFLYTKPNCRQKISILLISILCTKVFNYFKICKLETNIRIHREYKLSFKARRFNDTIFVL